MLPIYPYDSQFGVDKSLLLEEAVSVHQHALSYSNKSLLRKFPCNENDTPRLYEFVENFRNEFSHTDLGAMIGHYFYAYEGKNLEFHTDGEWNEGVKSFHCCFNFILSGVETPVEFEDIGKFCYDQALLNTEQRHRIHPVSHRVIARIAFKDYTYEEVVQKMKREK